jgi:hypothetical protein
MKGLVRSSGGDEISDPHRDVIEACGRMGWCHKELIKGFEPFFTELDYLFKYYHNKYLLSEHLIGVPYYIPQWMGGLGLSVGNQPEDQISRHQLQMAKWIYQNKIEKVSSIGLSKTCLIDTLIKTEIDSLLKLHEVPPIANFQELETEESERILIEEENQKCYNEAVEYIWRTKELDQFFITIDDDFIKLSSKLAMRKLETNRKIWQQAHRVVEDSDYPQLEWFRIWHQRQNKVKPIISMDASRANQRLVVALV